MPDVIPHSAFADHPDEIGPKLRRLAELASWGYRIPDGFALTRTGARRLADSERPGLPASLSAELAEQHDALCARLGRARPALAVRSATTAEDGDRRSFAGMYETVLGVRERDQLLAAIRTCVDSRAGARAAAYGSGGEMTVGVQELIAARAAGVVFSRHPVTHRADRLVVEAVLGLGSTMVDGVAEPDHIEVGRADLRILGYEVGDKRLRAEASDDGRIVLRENRGADRRARCLAGDQVGAICRAAVDIERRLGRAVDVEWVCADDGTVVIVQARPITGAPREARAPISWDPVRYAQELGRRGR